jgi:hypothetical protein
MICGVRESPNDRHQHPVHDHHGNKDALHRPRLARTRRLCQSAFHVKKKYVKAKDPANGWVFFGILLVGVAGIEPATPRSQSECATAAPHPDSVVFSACGTKQPNYCRTVNANSHNQLDQLSTNFGKYEPQYRFFE